MAKSAKAIYLSVCPALICSSIALIKRNGMFQYEDVSVKEVSQAVAVQQFYGIVAGSLNSVRKFMERVPGVSSLTPSDREAVLNAASLELLALRLAYR